MSAACHNDAGSNSKFGGSMTTRLALRLLSLAPIVLLGACNDSRDLPSAPSLSADRAAVEHRAAPSPRGYPLMAFDPVKDRVFLVGGFSTYGFDAEIFDVWSFNPRSRTW